MMKSHFLSFLTDFSQDAKKFNFRKFGTKHGIFYSCPLGDVTVFVGMVPFYFLPLILKKSHIYTEIFFGKLW